jgi:hypothetical protein
MGNAVLKRKPRPNWAEAIIHAETSAQPEPRSAANPGWLQ